MKKIIAFAFLVLILFVFSGIVSAAGVAITNETGFDIYEVHFAPGNESRWGDDVLNMNVILNDETVTVNWDKGGNNVWNIMVIDEHDRKFYWRNLNLGDGSRIILKPDGAAALQ